MEISAGPYSRVVMFGCVDMIAFGGLFFCCDVSCEYPGCVFAGVFISGCFLYSF